MAGLGGRFPVSTRGKSHPAVPSPSPRPQSERSRAAAAQPWSPVVGSQGV